MSRTGLPLYAGGILTLLTVVAAADYWSAHPADLQPTFVGRQSCVECHTDETAAFTGSHHDLAMDVANDQTVLGDFDDVEFKHHDITSRLYRDGDRFMVHTEGEDGQMADFEIKYVFGVDPLQQYMVEFDRDDSLAQGELPRLQVLRISWNVPEQKWFYLTPPDVTEKLQPGDPLHWTGLAQRWQTMCADCHSTNLQPNYDVATGKYHTTFSEIDVSCESCHGPGSLHVELANSKSLFWDRNHGSGLVKLKGDDPEPQLQSCAPCHSRRGLLDGTYKAGDLFTDHYELERLTDATYHADGQIKDEVYVFGSFIQSKMYHKGIRCTDCHDPHSLQRKHPGNETCTSCHQHAAGKYDTPSHHHHAVGTAGAMCVNCHMPHTTYMAIDDRRDHSLRVPRPDMSVEFGTPNACSGCHINDPTDHLQTPADQPLGQYIDWIAAAQSDADSDVAKHVAAIDRWCDDACETWYGKDRQTPEHYGAAFARFRRGDPDGASQLLRIATGDTGPSPAGAPDIARAAAWDELSMSDTPAHVNRAQRSAKRIIDDVDQSAMVRASAINTFATADATTVQRYLIPLLDDPSRLVRISATRTILASGAFASLSTGHQQRVEDSAELLRDQLDVIDDRASSHMSWAAMCESMQRYEDAAEAYQAAIRIEPNVAGPRSNYAALLQQLAAGPWQNRRDQLTAEIEQLRQDELPLLKRDAELVPTIAPVQYRYGLALYLAGQPEAAVKKLRQTVDLDPTNPTYRQAYQALQSQLTNPTPHPPTP